MRHDWRRSTAAGLVLLVAAGCAEPSEAPEEAPATTPAPVPTLKQLGWNGVQAPDATAVTVLGAATPLGGTARPAGPLLRVRLDAGRLYGTGSSATARAEVYGRNPTPWSTPAAQWPDPPGSVRWYRFSLYLPSSFPTSTDSADWLVLTQWKGRDGGSPPVSIEVLRDRLRLGGERSNEGLVPAGGDLGPLPLGTWTTLTVGIRFSTGADGWVEVWRDGQPVVPRTAVATMDVVGGAVDPVYLKQGIYRSKRWDRSQTAYFSTVQVSEQEPAA